MNDHNLDDLIIDTIAPKNNKTKSLLTIIALLIIVLIVAIILTKTLLKGPDTDELTFEENMSEMIAPELQLQAHPTSKPTEVSRPKAEPSLSEIIEDKIQDPKEEISTLDTTINEILSPKEEEKPTTPEAVSKPEETKKTKKTKTIQPIVKEKKTQTLKKPKATKLSGKYYVQVGSFKTLNPSERLLSVIQSSGFKYHISEPDSRGMKKLLIGPYQTREEIDKIRKEVRDRINKDAFVVER